MRFLAVATALVLAACVAPRDDSVEENTEAFTEASFVRPVVMPSAPLALDNPQDEAVTRPLWGGAFTLGARVGLRVVMEAGQKGSSGLLVGGRGDPEKDDDTTPAVALASKGSAWVLRELAGAKVVKEVDVAAPLAVDATLTVAADGRSLTARIGGSDHTIRLSKPLPSSSGVYVSLAPKATLAIRDVKLTQPLATRPDLGTPLRQLAAQRGVSIGTATDVWPPLHDAQYESILGAQFDTAAPTEFYWSTTRVEDEDFFFLPADLTVNYAQVHGQKINGYFLAWDFELPEWVNDVAKQGKDALAGKLEEHVTKVVGRYKGKMNAWIVANEAIWGPDETNGGPARFGDSVWTDTIGPEWIDRAFRAAHAADPKATLLYNETGAEQLGPKSDFVLQTVKGMKDRGVPIGGVGLQFHVDASKRPDPDSVQKNLARFGALGLDVYITELGVSLAEVKTGSEADKQKAQAAIYGDVVKACLAVPRCKSLTVFGFSDKYAWDELGDARPLVLDKDYAKKPAFTTLQTLLGR